MCTGILIFFFLFWSYFETLSRMKRKKKHLWEANTHTITQSLTQTHTHCLSVSFTASNTNYLQRWMMDTFLSTGLSFRHLLRAQQQRAHTHTHTTRTHLCIHAPYSSLNTDKQTHTFVHTRTIMLLQRVIDRWNVIRVFLFSFSRFSLPCF